MLTMLCRFLQSVFATAWTTAAASGTASSFRRSSSSSLFRYSAATSVGGFCKQTSNEPDIIKHVYVKCRVNSVSKILTSNYGEDDFNCYIKSLILLWIKVIFLCLSFSSLILINRFDIISSIKDIELGKRWYLIA